MIHRRSDRPASPPGDHRPDPRRADHAPRLRARTTIAEKGVTILERGITSTRWRDYVDIVQLARHGIDHDELLRSARAVARHRSVTLEPVAPYLAGYGSVGQAKWAAWRRKEHLESACEANLDDQITLVAACLDPVFGRGSE
jgi:Nucleotidyl transferase AbiEii toxin, Type IV TA system